VKICAFPAFLQGRREVRRLWYTAGSDQCITKAIIGYAFAVPGKGDRGDSGTAMPVKAPAVTPSMAKSATSAPWQTSSVPDVFAAMR